MVFADVTRAETELGWRAQRSIEQMCPDTWRWQSANPSRYSLGHEEICGGGLPSPSLPSDADDLSAHPLPQGHHSSPVRPSVKVRPVTCTRLVWEERGPQNRGRVKGARWIRRCQMTLRLGRPASAIHSSYPDGGAERGGWPP